MVIFIQHPLVLRRGTGAHQAHISLQHIEKLGKFIQAGPADEFANAGFFGAVGQNPVADDPGIPIQLEHKAAGNPVLLHMLFFELVRVGVHTPEFVHPEHLAVAADPLLTVENRARGGKIDGRADENGQHQGKQAAHQAPHNIRGPLDGRGKEADAVPVHRQHIVARQLFHCLFPGAHHIADIIDADVHRDSHGGHGAGKAQHLF